MLGPLVVRSGDREVAVSAPRQRIVLTTLLLNPNKVVSVDRIAQFVWDEPLPPSAAATVRTYVMRLRRVLGAFGAERIQTVAPGYRIRIEESDTDLGRFLAHRIEAKRLAESGDTAAAVRELDRGLALWRSDPFVDVPCSRLHDSEGIHLAELRSQTLGWRMDMQLELHRHAEILPELRRVVREQPLHEAFVGRLMLALSRVGRQPEALGLYQRIRADLIGQFGMEPGPELRAVQRRILRGEDEPVALSTTPHTDVPAIADTVDIPMPAQLPPAVRDFTGRVAETRDVRDLLIDGARAERPVSAVIVTGAAGVGKTSLLLRVAHAASGDFPDGQLYAGLEGAPGSPVEPACVALHCLIGLGLARSAIPDDDADRLALYRSVVARRRILIVLDDVCDAAQVRPLLPGSGESRILVGSRRRLAGLDGSSTVVLRSLDERTALDLLAGIIGRERIEAEPEAARALVRACAGLPLALRITGLRALSRPNRSLCETGHRLSNPAQVLDELQIGDLAVRSALARVYEALGRCSRKGSELCKAFRCLSMIPDHNIDARTVAVLLECSPGHAEELLDDLADAHLLNAAGGGHYTMDRLTAAFACERMYQEELSGSYVAALRRLGRSGYPADLPVAPPGPLPI